MNNIEKFAIEHGAKLAYTDRKDIFIIDSTQLEAFAKALQQSSEPVAVEKVEALLNKHKASIFKTIDVIPVSDGDVLITQDQLLNLISEYTHPPASVPLEKYNKLLEAFKKYAKHDTSEILCENLKHSDNKCNCGFEQAIAEAEGKEG